MDQQSPMVADMQIESGDCGAASDECHQIREIVRQLEQFGHRGSASRQERMAAGFIEGRLNDIGMSTRLEPFRGVHSYGQRILVHLVPGCLALLVVAWFPHLSLGISLLTLISFLGETSGIPYGLSSLLPGRPSQNVTGSFPVAGPVKRRLVVCAHIDTQQTGWIWNPRWMKSFATGVGLAPGPLKAPLFLVTCAWLIQLALAGAVLAGVPAFPFAFIGLIPGIIWLIAIVLVGQWSLGDFVPGANDNATGVASALALARRWSLTNHVDTELVILVSGCEEPGLIGAARWVGRHRQSLKETPTWFVNLDVLGCRDLHFLKAECALNGLIVPYPDDLLEICQEVAEEMQLPCNQPHRIPTHTDGLAFLIRGINGVTLTSSESGIYVPNYHLPDDRSDTVDFRATGVATEFAWRIMRKFESLSPEPGVNVPGSRFPD